MRTTEPGQDRRGTVVVLGATSFVGSYVLRRLLAHGYSVIAVTRRPRLAPILLPEFADRLRVARAEELAGEAPAEAVVNLAYVKVAVPHRVVPESAQIAHLAHDVTTRLGAPRLIHLSTVAVFGYELSGEPTIERAKGPGADPYIQSKIVTENELLRLNKSGDYALGIVRLGNVIGAGSPTWTGNLAQRLLQGQPVGVAGMDGYSNATLSENIASYLVHLLRCEPQAITAFGPFHHLAEFAEERWSSIIRILGRAVGVAPVMLEALPLEADMGLRSLFATKLKAALKGPAGSYVRSALGAVDAHGVTERILLSLKSDLAGVAVDPTPWGLPAERALMAIMSVRHLFRNHLMAGWTPPVSFGTALDEMERWVGVAGFGVRDACRDESRAESPRA